MNITDKERILVFGHKKPDTDAIAASISLAYLKRELGYNAEARVLGEPNNETKYALNYFNIDLPRYLNDVRIKIKYIDFLTDYSSLYSDSLFDGFKKMNEHEISAMPIVDEHNKFVGLVSLKDIAHAQFDGDITFLCTSYTNLIHTLNGIEVLKFDEEISGNIVIASYKSSTFMENVDINSETILIVGDRYNIIDYAINESE